MATSTLSPANAHLMTFLTKPSTVKKTTAAIAIPGIEPPTPLKRSGRPKASQDPVFNLKAHLEIDGMLSANRALPVWCWC